MKHDQTEFNAALKADLESKGFSPDEIMVGALMSEAKAGLACLNALGPRGVLVGAALSQTIGLMVGKLSDLAGVDGGRVVAVAEAVGVACRALSDAEMKDAPQSDAEVLREMAGAIKDRHNKLVAASGRMDPTGPTDPREIN
jgi:hypothetical protein